MDLPKRQQGLFAPGLLPCQRFARMLGEAVIGPAALPVAFQQTGTALSAETLRALTGSDAILLGAMGLPHIRYNDGTEISPQLDIREEL